MASSERSLQTSLGCLILSLALAIAVLSSGTFLEASGLVEQFRANERQYLDYYYPARVVCGIVIFLVTVFLFHALGLLARIIIGKLDEAASKPPLPVAVLLIICGTLCCLASLAIEAWAIYGQGSAALEFGPARAQIGGPSVMGHLLAVFVFIVGVSLIAIGVWSSIGRSMPTVTKVESV